MTKIVDIFVECLKNNDPHTSFLLTVDGGNGVTFLCTLPWKKLNALDLNPSWDLQGFFPFVLKWVNKGQASNEKDCAKWFRTCGLSAPFIRKIPESLSNKLSKYVHTKGAELGSKSYELMAMTRFQAMTLKSFIQEGHLSKLNTDALSHLFRTIGEGALCDLIIANNDRVISYDFESAQFLNFKSPILNLGNIMIEAPLMPPELIERSLNGIHFIDNNSAALPITPKTPHPSPSEDYANEIAPLMEHDPFTNVDHSFEFLLKNYTLLSDQIYQAFVTKCSDLSEHKELIKNALNSGIIQATQRIRNNEIEFKSTLVMDPQLVKINKIIKSNISKIKQGDTSNDSHYESL